MEWYLGLKQPSQFFQFCRWVWDEFAWFSNHIWQRWTSQVIVPSFPCMVVFADFSAWLRSTGAYSIHGRIYVTRYADNIVNWPHRLQITNLPPEWLTLASPVFSSFLCITFTPDLACLCLVGSLSLEGGTVNLIPSKSCWSCAVYEGTKSPMQCKTLWLPT